MHFLIQICIKSSKPVLKTLKTFKTLRHVSISCEIILREFFISLLRLLSLKFTKIYYVAAYVWYADQTYAAT